MKSTSSWRHRLAHLGRRMLHQKDVEESDLKTELRRCLSTPQLTLIGVGNTIGVGIYVMLGVMAKENAGPSVVFSFVTAIFVTMMNALVYAEFATFIPQTGAAYVYIYKVIGEFAAFLCGWVMLISFTMSGSVGARAWSGMVDSFFNNSIQDTTVEILGNVQFGLPFAPSLDILAFLFQITVTIIISCNVLCSSIINTILGILTSSVLVFVFIAGLIYGDAKNFTNAEHGGFFPFGIAGVIKGASLALYATSGFEIISLSAEEAKNPAKAVPRAVMMELCIVGTVYIGAAIGMLYLIPYWLIDLRAPLPSAFEHSGVMWGKMVVTVGPIFGITNLQMLGLYGLSRVLYRMSKDGLFFEWFLKVNKRTGVPLNSVVCVGCLTSVFALLLDLSYIVKITVLLMLLNYMIVGSALIKLKVQVSSKQEQAEKKKPLPTSRGKAVKHEKDFYEHEIVISEYETCESGESGEVETTGTDGNASTDALVDLSDDMKGKSGVDSSSDKPQAESRPAGDTQTDIRRNDGRLKNRSEQGMVVLSEKEDRETLEKMKTESGETLQGENSFSGNSQNFEAGFDCNEDESDEEHTEFQKSLKSGDKGDEINRNNSSIIEHNKHLSSSKTKKKSCRDRLAAYLSPFVPGVISVNQLLILHWICCISISMQINFGWEDLGAVRTLAVLSLSILVTLLVIFSVLLWSQCGVCTTPGFQTPMMPLIPTMSVLSSSMLLFSAGESMGFIEIAALLVVGSVIYITMVLVNYGTQGQSSGIQDQEEKRALVSGEEADDEVDSEDEL